MTRLRLLLLIAALVLFVVALLVWVGGGWTVEFGGVRLRVRRPIRVGGQGALLLAAWAAWARRRWREDAQVLARLPRPSPGGLAGVLSAAVFVAGVGFGTFVAGGADSYGYLSEADLLLQGRLRVPQELADAPWPDPIWTLSPLGYRPATVPGAIVPTYPPGLALLFAGARRVGGACAPYYVVPLAGALLVWLTYRLGARLLVPPLALAAALLLAASPSFLFQLVWPMSDVPAATLWLAAALLIAGPVGGAGRETRPAGALPRPLGAGLVASLAILVRPNLAPLAAVCLAALLVKEDGGRRGAGAIRRAALFVAGLLPGTAVLAALNGHLYGAWWRSGYGSTDSLYAVANILPNLRRYTAWTMEANTPVIFLGIVPLVAWAPFLPTRTRWRLLLTGLVAGVWLSYLPYYKFDDWWYLRFLLPAWPALAVLTVAVFHGGLARLLPGHVARNVVLVIALVLAGITFDRAKAFGAFDLHPGEQRYVDAGTYVGAHTPPGSVVLSMQHSGSVRYYGGRTTVRYDLLEPEWLDRAIAFLERKGRAPFVLLEDWEVPLFQARFKNTAAGTLDWSPVAEWQNGKVLLFDASARTLYRRPDRIPPAGGCGRMK